MMKQNSIVVWVFFLLSFGCRSTKSSYIGEYRQKDSTISYRYLQESIQERVLERYESRDTTLRFPEKWLNYKIDATDWLGWLANSEKKDVTKTFEQHKNGLKSKIQFNIDGSVDVDCKADSFIQVINALKREHRLIQTDKKEIDSSTVQQQSSIQDKITEKIQKKARENIIPIALLLCLILYAILNPKK